MVSMVFPCTLQSVLRVPCRGMPATARQGTAGSRPGPQPWTTDPSGHCRSYGSLR